MLKELAVFIGDHITAPIRKVSYELRTGKPARIERITEFETGIFGEQSRQVWFVIPKDATPEQRTAIIERW